jgi:hypothetical protein
MSDKVDPAITTAGYEDEPSSVRSLERQILLDLLATSVRFCLVVVAVVLAVHGLSPA